MGLTGTFSPQTLVEVYECYECSHILVCDDKANAIAWTISLAWEE